MISQVTTLGSMVIDLSGYGRNADSEIMKWVRDLLGLV